MALVNKEPRVSARSSDSAAAIRLWLSRFAAAVRAVDYAAASALFDNNVVSFGTFARMVHGRDELVAGQWQNIWSCTRGFDFLLDEAHIRIHDGLAWIATPWLSQGRDEAGRWYDRPGRCTLILECRGDEWLCVHSHFSRQPTPRCNGTATPE